MEKAGTTIVADLPAVCRAQTEAPPIHLALSADDLTLAVCINKNNIVCAKMYDVRVFATKVRTAPHLHSFNMYKCIKLVNLK